jgi:hypothetical protein
MKTIKTLKSLKPSSKLPLAIVLLLTLLFTVATNAQTAAANPETTAKSAIAPQPWKQIPIPPLHAFKPAQPKRIELANGLVIFLQEDHELPFINGSILIRGGSRDEPATKTGLVSLYGDTWRTSGTATIDGDKLDDQLEAKAASIETSGGIASTSMPSSPTRLISCSTQPSRQTSSSWRSSSNTPPSRAATMTPPASQSARPSKSHTAPTIPTPDRPSTPPSPPSLSTTSRHGTTALSSPATSSSESPETSTA